MLYVYKEVRKNDAKNPNKNNVSIELMFYKHIGCTMQRKIPT